MKTFLLITEGIIEWTGKIVAWLVVIMTGVLGYEVLMRYYFNAPIEWAYDVSSMLGGTFWILGAGYTLMKHKHVRIDILYSRFSRRQKTLLDVIFTSVVFFPVWIGILYRMIPYVSLSWQTKERSLESFWRPPIYPLKTIMLVGVCLLLLAGISLVFGFFFIGPEVIDIFIARIFGLMKNYVFLSAPLFLFMGVFMEKAGVAESLYGALYQLLGGLRGGLAIATIALCTIFAAATGIVGASEVTIGLLALPAMIKRNDNISLACGSICAGGALGILIPPSVMIVLYGPTAGLSVG